MGKRRRGSRSQKIREFLQENPSATPSQIVEGLAKQGTKVSPGLASNVKYTSGTGAKRTVRRRRKRTTRKAPSRGLTAQDLMDAKKLVDDLGGIAEVRKALDALEKLR